jgi:hypothetical protein
MDPWKEMIYAQAVRAKSQSTRDLNLKHNRTGDTGFGLHSQFAPGLLRDEQNEFKNSLLRSTWKWPSNSNQANDLICLKSYESRSFWVCQTVVPYIVGEGDFS